MSDNIHCPMIHGGLQITLKQNSDLQFNQCCLSTTPLTVYNDNDLWSDKSLTELRIQNRNNIWDKGCWQCKTMEQAGNESFRTALIKKFGNKVNLSGPQRIDLLFDRSCNLTCLYCGPESSTSWQKYNYDNNLPQSIKFENKTTKNKVFSIIENLNLENIEQIQFCGGETLLGNSYLDTAKYIGKLIPKKAKTNFEIAFQTNGTQPWRDEFYEIFDLFKLVKIVISLDCVGKRFEYSRWPASWNQVTDNILQIREKSPPNVMFIFQEVITNLSLFYYGENECWIRENFKDNRVTDPTTHGAQLVLSDYLDVNNITQEYYNEIKNTNLAHFLKPNWVEKPKEIQHFLTQIKIHDTIRKMDWKTAYPEVAKFYERYI